jgi:hypothetical protein
MPSEQSQLYNGKNLLFQRNVDDVNFVVRHVAPLGHIILILSQQSLCSFSLIPGQAVKTNSMVLG